jgi:hypothetical protein
MLSDTLSISSATSSLSTLCQWGDKGYFKILRGAPNRGGECEIESDTVAAIPILH